MITLRPAAERGHADHGWLDARHTFSFADYQHPDYMGFGALRVMNEDRVQPGKGFGTHGHRDMEIVTYVLEGALEHRDNMGNGSLIQPGEVQRMTAGTGVLHSEVNPSDRDVVHLYQIWLLPERDGLEPGYEQREFADAERRNRLRVIASRDGRDGSLTVHQDATMLAGLLDAGTSVEHLLQPGRRAWLQVARGEVRLGDATLGAGDGAALEGEPRLRITATQPAEVLVFDLA